MPAVAERPYQSDWRRLARGKSGGLSAADFANKVFDTAGLQAFDQRQQLIDAMTSGSKTRAQVLRDVVEIAEFKTREYNPSLVLRQYFGYLQRDPDQEGYSFWLEVLEQPRTE